MSITIIEVKKIGEPAAFTDKEIKKIAKDIALSEKELVLQSPRSDLHKIAYAVTDRLQTIDGVDIYNTYIVHPWDKDTQWNLKVDREIVYLMDAVETIVKREKNGTKER